MSRRDIALTLVIILAGVLSRAVLLDADPPSWQQLGFLSDEGWWAHNGRNRVDFGRFVIEEPRDEFNQGLWLSPLFTLLVAGSFSIFGSSLFALRLVSSLASGVTALGLAFAGRRLCDKGGGPLCAFLYLFAPFTWSFGRLGLVEESMNAFLALSVAAFLARGTWPPFVAGIFHAAAFAVKSYAAPALVPFVVVTLVGRSRRATIRFLRYAAGGALGLVPWFFGVYLPYRTPIGEMGRKLAEDNMSRSVAVMGRNALDLLLAFPDGRPALSPWVLLAPVPIALMVAAAARLLLGASLAPRRRDGVLFAASFLLVYLLLMLPLQHRPERRYLVLMLPTILLAVAGLDLPPPSGAPGRLRRLAAALPAAFLAASACAAFLPGRNSAALAVVLLTPVAVLIIHVAIPRLMASLPRFRRSACILAVVFYIVMLGSYFGAPRFTERDEGRAIARIVKRDRVLGGVADSLLLESEAMTFATMRKGSGGRFNEGIRERASVDWLLMFRRSGGRLMMDRPGMLEGTELARESDILPTRSGPRATVYLYRLTRR